MIYAIKEIGSSAGEPILFTGRNIRVTVYHQQMYHHANLIKTKLK